TRKSQQGTDQKGQSALQKVELQENRHCLYIVHLGVEQQLRAVVLQRFQRQIVLEVKVKKGGNHQQKQGRDDNFSNRPSCAAGGDLLNMCRHGAAHHSRLRI